jgi:hypothetical protein
MEIDNSQLWKKVEQDKLKYKFFLILSLTTWVIAISTLAYIGYLFFLEYQHIYSLYEVAVAKQTDLYEAKKNIYIVVLAISIIVACLSSVVLLMRQRSSSLQDIQLRLAIVEQQITESK